MAIWHFRKKSTDGRKRPRSGNSLSDVEDSSPSPPQTDPVLSQDTGSSGTRPQQPRTPKRRSTLKKKRRTESPSQPRLHGDASTRHARAFSFTEDRSESISPQVPPEVIVQDNIVWEIPTLSPHRPEKTNRLSKKHYRRDAARETEIQAISTVLNTRPNSTCSRQISRKTSSKHKHSSSLQHRYTFDERDEMEFPSAESLRSSMSSDGSDSAAYLVTVLGSLAPRPTLKCTSRPNWSPNVDRTSASRAHRSIDLSPTPSNIKSRARINGLADAFDSTDLRTVMERDQRRRERKRIRDQERAAERIARKKAEQAALAEQAAASKSTPPRNMERGVLGRELMDPVEIHARPSTPQRMEIDELVLEEESFPLNNSRPATPESLVGGDGADAGSVLSVVETQDYGMDNVSVEADVGVVVSSPTYPSSELLPEGLASNETVDQTEIDRNRLQPEVFVESEPQPILQTRPHASSVSFTPTLSPSAIIASDVDQSSTSTRRRSLRTMLRWGSRKRKKAQPVFVNTSRDAISIETARSREFASSSIYDSSDYELPIPNNPTRIVPRRTRSRFREDLPELPISPPASPLRQERDLSTIMSVSERMSVLYSSTSSPTSTRRGRHRSIDALNCSSPTPLERQAQNELGDEQLPDTPSPEPRSISMASVGSESEWLAGRLSSRNLPISRSTSRRYADSPELDYDDEATNKVSTEFRFVRGSSSQAHHTDANVQETVGQEGGSLADVMGDSKACPNTDTVAEGSISADTTKNPRVLQANVRQQSLDAEDHQVTTGSGNMF